MAQTRLRRYAELGAVAVLTAALVAPLSALALGEFSDVPDDHIFAEDIAWLADNQITTGCGDGKYCPADPVTRGQMAAFMRRLATRQVVDANTAVQAASADTAGDAALLDGLPSSDIASRLSAEDDGVTGSVLETNKGLIKVNEVTIDAPEPGVLLISGTGFVDPESIGTDFILQTKVNGVVVGSPGWSAWFRPANDQQSFEMSYTVARSVAAGTHTVTQLLGPRQGTSTFFHNHETLSVLFVPNAQASFESSAASSGAQIVPSELGGEAD